MEEARAATAPPRRSSPPRKLVWALIADRRRLLPGRRRASSGRAGERDLGRHGRAGGVPDCSSLLWPVRGRQGARARPEPRDAGRAAERRPRLRAHPQVGRLRTPLRRDRGRGSAGRPRACRADGVLAGDALDPGRGGVRGSGAGLHDPGIVAAPRRPFARARCCARSWAKCRA